MLKNKKAISALIATVLLILITIAGVAIIAGAVIPMITKITQSGQACTSARLNIDTSAGFTCLNSTGVNVNIVRGPEDFDLAAIQLIILDDTGTTKEIVMSDASKFPGINGGRVYTILKSGNWTGNATEVRVAPIVKVGNTKTTCDISAKVSIPICA